VVVEIQPEPSEDERAAILVAVEQLLAEDSGRSAGSRWWQTGLRDDLDEDELP
jgi:hypothetical protein